MDMTMKTTNLSDHSSKAHSATGLQRKDPISYEQMADILADTIVFQEPPLTVGMFGKWSSGKTFTLRRCNERMEKVTSSVEKNDGDLSVNIFYLLFRLFFSNPVLASTTTQEIRYIFVDLNILDYAGSDNLWAGVITHIAHKVDELFGRLAVKIFRAWHYRPEIDLKPFIETPRHCKPDNSKTLKFWRMPPLKVYLLPFLVVLLIATALTLWLVHGVPSLPSLSETSSIEITTIVATSAVGIGFGLKLTDLFKISLHLIKTQTQKISAMAKDADFSSSLGFMWKVKTELNYITALVRYMSVVLKKNIRICLIIDDIDLLGKDKIMDLFQIITLLHATNNSLYVQILCMDPMIAANLIKKALSKELFSDISGHAYLRKHIELPFQIPQLDTQVKKQCLLSAKKVHLKPTVLKKRSRTHVGNNERFNKDDAIEMKQVLVNPAVDTLQSCAEEENFISLNKVNDNLLNDPHLMQCIEGNEKTIKRISLSAQIALRMFLYQKSQDVTDEDMSWLVAWISFVDQWPYRVSWIRQVLEDNGQMHKIDPDATHLISANAFLSDVYHLVITKLAKPEEWQNLLDLDGDPELFVTFLYYFRFKVKDMIHFLPYTTNLNSSIRRIIAHSSANDLIQNRALLFEKSQRRWRHMMPLKFWTTDEVCEEIDRMGLSEHGLLKYKKIIQEQQLCGMELCETPLSELRNLLNSNPGDWSLLRDNLAALKTFYGI